VDLGDRSSCFCVLDEAGEVLMEQKVATTPKAMKEVFSKMPRSRMALETGLLQLSQARRGLAEAIPRFACTMRSADGVVRAHKRTYGPRR
jgi:hypothetical protein